MGQPVVHFEIIGRDGAKLQSYYSELFGWEIDAYNPMSYGIVTREGNTNADGVGIGGGIAAGPEDYEGHVTFYIEVPDVEAALAKAESLGGTRVMGPETIMETIELGLFTDPEGHLVGVVKRRLGAPCPDSSSGSLAAIDPARSSSLVPGRRLGRVGGDPPARPRVGLSAGGDDGVHALRRADRSRAARGRGRASQPGRGGGRGGGRSRCSPQRCCRGRSAARPRPRATPARPCA